MQNYIKISEEVRAALNDGAAVVALESNVLAHGKCAPNNYECGLSVERAVRETGGIPATIGIDQGRIIVGMTKSEVEYFCDKGAAKVGSRELAWALVSGVKGVTSVSATMVAAEKAGIKFISSPGLGGVHRDGATTMDISSDLIQLTRSNLVVVSAGAKNILDLSLTLEFLETHGVPVVGFACDEFPAFYCRSSGLKNPMRVDSFAQSSQLIRHHEDLNLNGSILFTAPIAKDFELDEAQFEGALSAALKAADEQKLRGGRLTPFLIREVDRLTEGQSSKANSAVLIGNARLTAQIAKAYAGDKMKQLIAFDLDGTLVDTPRAVVRGFSHALSALGIEVPAEDKIRGTIGLPLETAFASLIGDHSPDISKCIELYRSYYFAEIVPQARDLVFAGVRSGLAALKSAGHLLAVATNKQTPSATALLVQAELYHLFDFVAGADLVKEPKPAPDILQLLSQHFQLDAKKILFVGDTVHDLECAKNFSVECAAVTYGIGSASDLCEASFLAPQFSIMVDWILGARAC